MTKDTTQTDKQAPTMCDGCHEAVGTYNPEYEGYWCEACEAEFTRINEAEQELLEQLEPLALAWSRKWAARGLTPFQRDILITCAASLAVVHVMEQEQE